MITIVRTTSENTDFDSLVKLLDAYLWKMYPETQAQYDNFNVIFKNDTVVIAYSDAMPVGCGCFKQLDDTTVEIKRMFVKEEYRGKGISHLILQELEDWAKESGFQTALLETLDKQTEAIGLYNKRGYKRTQNYGPYIGLEKSICMRKEL